MASGRQLPTYCFINTYQANGCETIRRTRRQFFSSAEHQVFRSVSAGYPFGSKTNGLQKADFPVLQRPTIRFEEGPKFYGQG
jgi:hypothetical protein